MTPRARRRAGPAWWLFPALLALTLAPAALGWAALALAVAGAGALGWARRAAERRARAAAQEVPGSPVLLGENARGRPVLLSDRQLSAHGLIVGASGAGKSTTMLTLLTEHILRGRPVVAIDMKGSPDFARQLELAAQAAGRPFQVWSPDGPAQWNPLQHGNATELKDKLIATERFTEPHYQRAAERFVQIALQVLQAVHPERAPTIEEVVDVMDPRRLGPLVRALPRERAGRVQDYLATLTPDQESAVRGLGTRLAILTESHTGRFLIPGTGGTIDLRRALDGNEVVVFSLNSSTYGKLAGQLGTLAIQDLITAVGERQERVERPRQGERRPDQALVGIDEFSALGSDNVISLLARGRSAGVSALLATQELADLERAGRGLADQILGITAIKIVHRQDVPASAQTIAQMAGTERVWESTYSIGRGPLGDYGTSRGTRREVERFVVHPNEIKTLRTGEAIVIAKIPQTSVQRVRVAPPRAAPAPAASSFESASPGAESTRTVRPSSAMVRAGSRSAAASPVDRSRPVPPSRAERGGPELG